MISQLQLEAEEGRINARWRGKVVWAYDFARSPKPHVSLLATPTGQVVSLDSPHDHVHHRGLMFACKAGGVNFWEEVPNPGEEDVPCGEIVHLDWMEQHCDGNALRLTESLAWQNPSTGVSVLQEERRLCVRVDETRQAVRCDWGSRLSNPGSRAIELSGRTPFSPISYYGLGVRFARALDHGGIHQNADGPCTLPAANGTRCAWHDYSGMLDNSHARVGVLIADAPSNPRHPTPWFIISHPPMPFAFVTASLLAHEDYTLPPNGVLELHYCIWAHDGHWQASDCQDAASNSFSTLQS